MGNLFGKHHKDPRWLALAAAAFLPVLAGHVSQRLSRRHGHKRAITDTDKAVLQLKTQRRQLTAQRTRVRRQPLAKHLVSGRAQAPRVRALRTG
jgi:hypothetical protein